MSGVIRTLIHQLPDGALTTKDEHTSHNGQRKPTLREGPLWGGMGGGKRCKSRWIAADLATHSVDSYNYSIEAIHCRRLTPLSMANYLILRAFLYNHVHNT